MELSFTEHKRPRASFARQADILKPPDLLDTQRKSYAKLVGRSGGERSGLEKCFAKIFPIRSSNSLITLEYISHRLQLPEFTERECKQRSLSYAAKIMVKLRLNIRSREDRSIKEGREEEVFMGDLPLMTPNGSFVINGTERVVVSQLHRAPSVYFMRDNSRSASANKINFLSRIIPNQGCWLDFEFDSKNLLHFRIDKRQKQHVTLLLMSLGYSRDMILKEFYDPESINLGGKPGEARYTLREEQVVDVILPFDICAADGRVLAPREVRIKPAHWERIKAANVTEVGIDDEFIIDRRAWEDFVDEETGEVMLPANKIIDAEDLALLRSTGTAHNIRTIYVNASNCGDHIARTLDAQDADSHSKSDSLERAREQIYKKLRPGDPIVTEVVSRTYNDTFFNAARYNLSRVGRMKMNQRLARQVSVRPSERANARKGPKRKTRPLMEWCVELSRRPDLRIFPKVDNLAALKGVSGLTEEDLVRLHREVRDNNARVVAWHMDEPAAKNLAAALYESSFGARVIEQTVLSREDILNTVKELVNLANGMGSEDDIDSLGNRRVRSVGEGVQGYYEAGLARFERAIVDRLSHAESENLRPADFVNAKTIGLPVRDFFSGNQLSQFMDQNNPLSEITHKRRVSALGIGGLQRDRAGFEVRDVHPTHYGRLCPIETPEGPNIGLINSLALYATTDEYGFIVTPYRKVKDGKVTAETVELSASEERGTVIAQANAALDEDGSFVDELVGCRRSGECVYCEPSQIRYIDVAPSQIASAAAALIPFLEHNDANRALMGSNMQRQALPGIRPEKPLVGTGQERIVAVDSGQVVCAARDGRINLVDASKIVVRASHPAENESGVDIYNMTKFMRSNQNTNINQRPIVKVGDEVRAGDIIADGSATDIGELALGQNLLVAFLPWNGYNFEDAILVSERVVVDDRFTSIHIEEHTLRARETRNGMEHLTRDIPNQSEVATAHLDESGIIQIGTEVAPGDILVGKVTPKQDQQPTPEDRLIRAIFGDKGEEVKDTSLRLPTGGSGTVIDVKVFTEDASARNPRALSIIAQELDAYRQDLNEKLRIYKQDVFDAAKKIAAGCHAVASGPNNLKKGAKVTRTWFNGLKDADDWQSLRLVEDEPQRKLEALKSRIRKLDKSHNEQFSRQRAKLERGDILQGMINEVVKVYVAIKRNLQVGDKMAGRHGNKGVISSIVPVEDMPFLKDGTPVDIVLNPLGVPSRMNIGQVLETHLGLAAKGLGRKIAGILDNERGKAVAELRRELPKIYARRGMAEKLDFSDYSDDEIVATARELTAGVPLATPIFDGAGEKDITDMLDLAGCPANGQMTLFDGLTSEPFASPVTVGQMYMLKLHHLVEEKMHARSTGPYSLVTQQPLGGKAQQGGQRLGEMEVWALEAYGAAHTLWEMLTVKSDDIAGRQKIYESIVAGEVNLDPGVPESFKVLKCEIRALGIEFEEE